MNVALFVWACVLSVVACAVPNLPFTFTAKVTLLVVDHQEHQNDTGSGLWAVDEKAGASVQNFVYSKGYYDSFSLNRYDLGKMYRMYTANSSRCDQFPVEGEMQNPWAWVEHAEFAEHQTYKGKSVDIWQFNVGYGSRRIAVLSSNTSVPAWLDFHSGERDSLIEFDSFSPVATQVSVFTVPKACSASLAEQPHAGLACISSAEVMQRANAWLDAKVPYNTGGVWNGYREDCSGYVSYCWASGGPGHSTSTMHEIAHPITKAELVPGDCMLYAGDHVCLFGGWIDAAKTHYWAYEETQPCSDNPNWCNTRKDDVAYPYYYDPSDFLPYRYNNFCGK